MTAAVMASGLTLAGCSSSSTGSVGGATAVATKGGTTPKVGVILPDTKSSARWATADLKYLTDALKAAGVDADIQNAQGDKTQFQTI
ncbi:MAG: sugar ABC transporter substrate-binding protein, partial [Terracoccus sp.]